MITLVLLMASVSVLGLGTWVWKLTGSKTIMANIVFASVALLLAASSAYRSGPNSMAAMVAFFATMVLGGRALGTWLRSMRQAELSGIAGLLGAAACCALAATVVVAWPLM